ncbi:AAA family ATPase [Yangia sp. PrR004]|nr:AAA family ATPase [Salipiger sp. PrR004]
MTQASKFTLKLQRRLLRSLAQRYSIQPQRKMDEGHVADLGAALTSSSLGVPLASELSPAEISEYLARDEDPYAIDIHGKPLVTVRARETQRLISAARLAALIISPASAISMVAPGALTIIRIPERDAHTHLCQDAEKLCDLIAQADPDRASRWLDLEVVCKIPEILSNNGHERAQLQFEERLDAAIAKGGPVLVIATAEQRLTPSARAFDVRSVTLPQIDREMLLELLRVTHSTTGQIAEEAVHALLPPDLSRLPLPALQSSFGQPTTLSAAKRLMDIFKTVSKPPEGPTLSDIYLPTAAAQHLGDMATDLAAWQRGEVSWKEVSSSAFLYGPPGNGKTFTASALAGSTGAALIATSYADCQRHGHQGDFLRALHAKVTEAIARAPSILFIDELDSFQARDTGDDHGSRYVAGIVNALLEHLSVLSDSPGVMVLAAANFPELVDPAILRAGRFDTHLEIGRPDRAAISAMLNDLLTGTGIAVDATADQLIGLSGAEVAAVVRDARGRARRANETLAEWHLRAAADTHAPPRPAAHMHRVALHEAGHALVAYRLSGFLPAYVRLTPRGGEVTGTRPLSHTLKSAEFALAALLAGRAAERLVLGNISSGAESDLAAATELAYQIRHRWCLHDDVPVFLPAAGIGRMTANSDLSTSIARDLHRAELVALEVLGHDRVALDRLSELLLLHREMDAPMIALALSQVRTSSSCSQGKPPP